MRFSISAKTIILIVALAVVLSSVAVIICSRTMSNMIDAHKRDSATELAATVARVIDVDKFVKVRDAVFEIYQNSENKVGSDQWGTDEFYEYIGQFSGIEEMSEFKDLRDQLRSIEEVNDVDCIYLVYIDAATESGLYIVDAAFEDACPPGVFDQMFDSDAEIFKDPEYGLPAYTTNTEEYGWLMTAGVPIHNAEGEVVGHSVVDVSMNKIKNEQSLQVWKIVGYLVMATLILCVVSIVIVDHVIINPITTIAKFAENYCSDEDPTVRSGFEDMHIKNHDEIGSLAESMKHMEQDINDHITKLLKVNNELTASRQIANRMTKLANKDSLTGVRNKTSYDNEIRLIENGLAAGVRDFGVAMIDVNYLKRMNDSLGHEAGDKYIIAVCNVICDVFDHSPVFRIGGDEFAVILQNKDYNNAGELVEKFNAIIKERSADESLPAWERTSAAIGYALFDASTDKSVADVFKRADDQMYENKRSMKGGRE